MSLSYFSWKSGLSLVLITCLLVCSSVAEKKKATKEAKKQPSEDRSHFKECKTNCEFAYALSDSDLTILIALISPKKLNFDPFLMKILRSLMVIFTADI